MVHIRPFPPPAALLLAFIFYEVCNFKMKLICQESANVCKEQFVDYWCHEDHLSVTLYVIHGQSFPIITSIISIYIYRNNTSQ